MKRRRLLPLLAAPLLGIGLSAVRPAQAGGPDFLPLDRAGARALVSTPPKGPTVLALWTSDCVYCKTNLRTLAGLARQYPQLRILTLAAEIPAPETRTALDRTGLISTRYAYGDDMPAAIAYAIDPDWRGELPRSYLFDGHGSRIARSGLISAAEFRRLLGLR